MADRDGGIVVVGAGQAALTLAETLRRGGETRAITLIGEEAHPPYQRPPLSKAYLSGDMPRERLWLKPPDWYAAQGIELVTGVEVAAIDRERSQVSLSDGGVRAYGHLVLATGSRPRPLPETAGGALPGVHLIRGIDDIDRLQAGLAAARRILVIGGGYIGLEAAAVARGLGKDVTLIEAGSRILARVACDRTAGMVRALHEGHGVDLREGVGVERLTEGPDGRVAGALRADGTGIATDLVIVGIGGIANDALARKAGLVCGAGAGGIHVDATCRTSDPRILAIGDVALFDLGHGPMRLESVQNACDQARAAAATLMGRPEPYAPVPWFWSDQYDRKLQIAGVNTGADRTFFRPGRQPGTGSVWYFRGRSFVAVDALSDPRAYMTGKRWLETGAAPCPERLADPSIDLPLVLQDGVMAAPG
ncbi:FAD-dependent oxidoreductase [Rhodobacterales bacterium HKCCSP123]|nr:FAD-dependent oxidoreductase [Rhodobacterales bacterium HKCCSP123]